MRPISVVPWLWPLAMLFSQTATATTQYFELASGLRTAPVENGCPAWVREGNQDDCTYNRSETTRQQWVGPVFSAGYYAPGTAPQVFQSTPAAVPVTAPAPESALLPNLIGIPITGGFISIDDRDTATGDDDVIAGTIEFGGFQRNVGINLTDRAIESFERIIHRLNLTLSTVSSGTANGSGGFDFLVGATPTGTAAPPLLLNGFTSANGGFNDQFPSQVASQSSTDPNDIPYWDDVSGYGIAAFEGATRLTGTSTSATVWGYSCDAGTGPGSCETGGLLGGSNTQVSLENVLLRISTDGAGNLTLGEAYLVNYSDLSQTIPGVDSWQATILPFTGTRTSAPLAFRDRITLRSGLDASVTADVLANDAPGVAPVIVQILSGPASGTAEVLTGADANKIRYTPATANPPSSDQVIQYQITDANSATSTSFLDVTVFDDMPVANPDTVSVEEGIANTVDVVANDEGTSNSPLVLIVTSPTTPGVTAHGTYYIYPAAGSRSPVLRYTPTAGFTGTDSLSYQLMDADGDVSNQTTVTLNVSDSAPVAVNDTATAESGVELFINVLTGAGADSGLADSPVALTVTTPPAHGTAVVAPSSGGFLAYVKYTSDAGFTGTDTFNYTVTDTDGDVSQPATVTITISDTAPQADDDTFNGSARAFTPMLVLNGDTVGPDKPVTMEITQQPTLGTARVTTSGSGAAAVQDIEYRSNVGTAGTDTLKYRLHDANGSVSNEATVTITVANETPNAVDDPTQTVEDNTATTLDAIRVNDTGTGNRVLTMTIAQQPSHGQVVVIAGSDVSDPAAVYTPDSGYTGDDSFRYSLRDADGDVSPTDALVPITVADTVPHANDDARFGSSRDPFDIDVLLNDTGIVDFPVTMQITELPTQGTAVPITIVRSNGARLPGISYSSARNSSGTDTVKYTITDRDGDVSNVGTVTLTIVDGAPTAIDDAGGDPGLFLDSDVQGLDTIDAQLPTTIDVLHNDTGLDNSPLTITVTQQTAHGTLTPVPATETSTGRPALRYQSAAGYVGPDSFRYSVTDGDGEISNEAMVSFQVVSFPLTRNDGEPESIQTNQNVPVTINVLANDGGLAFGPITVAIVGDPVNGTAVVNTDNTITFTPAPGFTGQRPSQQCPFSTCVGGSFRYSITDSFNQRSEADVFVDVFPGAVVDSGGTSSLDVELLALFVAAGIARRRYRRIAARIKDGP